MTGRPQTSFYEKNTGAASAGNGTILAGAAVNSFIEWPICVAPNDTILFQANADNTGLTLFAWGYERAGFTDEFSIG